jgi:hypothetical protein
MAPRRRRGAQTEDSGDGEQPETEKLKNRPPNTAFRQQRMRAWQCVLTPKLIVTVFSILAAVYIGFGVWLTIMAFQVRDIRVDYTTCQRDGGEGRFERMPRDKIVAHFSSSDNSTRDPYVAEWQRSTKNVTYGNYSVEARTCLVRINIPEDLEPKVAFYYFLQNFYQNHRKYVQSFHAQQLLGDAVDGATINDSNCDPMAYDQLNRTGKIIYPCGVVANSLFNDTFSEPLLLNVPTTGDGSARTADNVTYPMANNSGISWPALKDLYGRTKYALDQIVPPPNWQVRYRHGYTEENPPPDLREWEAFQNWMMLAAAPDFYKLYQQNDRDSMLAGQYQIEIVDNFDVTVYNGKKSFLITTVTTMGARNIWPGIIFLIVGGICLILDIYFFLSYFLWKPRKMGDPTHLSWNKEASAPGQRPGTGPP